MGKSPKHKPYEEMKDTPWITQARQIADIGGKGVLDNYNKVNVFDNATRRELDRRNNETYNRAFDNMEREYTNIMNKYNAKNYNQFGTLNATAPSFVTDSYKRDFQRQMDDMAYNKAAHYDELMDNELRRRYNTLDMYDKLYQYGQIPYDLDLKNWNIRNTNKDIDFENHKMASRSGFAGALGGGLSGAMGGFLTTGSPWGALAGGALGAAGGAMGGRM